VPDLPVRLGKRFTISLKPEDQEINPEPTKYVWMLEWGDEALHGPTNAEDGGGAQKPCPTLQSPTIGNDATALR